MALLRSTASWLGDVRNHHDAPVTTQKASLRADACPDRARWPSAGSRQLRASVHLHLSILWPSGHRGCSASRGSLLVLPSGLGQTSACEERWEGDGDTACLSHVWHCPAPGRGCRTLPLGTLRAAPGGRHTQHRPRPWAVPALPAGQARPLTAQRMASCNS